MFWAPTVHSMYSLRHVGHEHDCGCGITLE